MGDPKPGQREIAIPSIQGRIQEVETFVEDYIDMVGMSGDARDDVAIAVTEAVNNAIVHGNQRNEGKQVHVVLAAEDGDLVVRIRDEGDGFRPENLPDPLAKENLMREDGRGIFILKALMDEVDYEFSETGTTVILKKKIA